MTLQQVPHPEIATLRSKLDEMRAKLVDQTQDALIVRDTEDRIQFWNEGAERMYGWRADEAIGQNFFDLLFTKQQGSFQQGSTLLETGEWAGEHRQITKSLRWITVQSHCRLHRDASGLAQYVSVVNKDITEKKNFESEILRMQRLECIGIIASSIAHDLNNVLPAMLISIRGLQHKQILFEGWPTMDDTLFQVEHAVRIISQLLSLGKSADEGTGLVNVAGMISETEKILKGSFPKRIEIKTVISPDLPLIAGNATQLYQLLLNLCLNARDAMESAGCLTIEVDNITFNEADIRQAPEARGGKYVRVRVTDTGKGISPEIVSNMFAPFSATHNRNKGQGLGLFSVSRIVRRHDGFIEVLQGPISGTHFVVYLPVESPNRIV